MGRQNPMARKHPWLLTAGILAGAAALVGVALFVVLLVALSTWQGGF